MKLALVIPALNEEQAIASTLQRALAARQKVVEQTDVTEMVIVFVNDGSTDGTQKIVDQPEFDEVVKVCFERNRGYGAAIKAGWQTTDADLVGFIDGDGTCDPDFCVPLVRRLTEREADVVLAARLNSQSKMPMIRKFGNRLFAALLGMISGCELTDTASGFRIVRRRSLRLLSPLPDGLHFTPAMSCICLLDPRLRIEEVPMPYEQRIGRSKLSVVKDGFRFLFTILFSACCYAPLKTMLGAGALVSVGYVALALLVLAAGGMPLVTIGASVLLVFLMIATGLICHQLNYLLISPRHRLGVAERLLQWLLNYKRLIVGGTAASLIGVVGLGTIFFWKDQPDGGMLLAIALLLMVVGGVAALGGVIVRVIWAVGERQRAFLHDGYAVRSPAELGQRQPPEPTIAETLVGDDRPTQGDKSPVTNHHAVVGTQP